MRYLFVFLCVCALGLAPLVGCADVTSSGNGGSDGMAGSGGMPGTAGAGGSVGAAGSAGVTDSECEKLCGAGNEADCAPCDDSNTCTANDCVDTTGIAVCANTAFAGGTSCPDLAPSPGQCNGAGVCELASCPCGDGSKIDFACPAGEVPRQFLCFDDFFGFSGVLLSLNCTGDSQNSESLGSGSVGNDGNVCQFREVVDSILTVYDRTPQLTPGERAACDQVVIQRAESLQLPCTN